MRVIALVAAHNRRARTLKCLASYFGQHVRPGIALSAVLVDDGSVDGTAEAVRERFPQARVLVGNSGLFWARAMAIAEETAHSEDPDFVLWVNDDAVLDQGAVRALIETAEAATGDACIVAGALRDPTSGALTYSGVRRIGLHPLRFALVPPTDRPIELETFNGNVVLVSRAALERVGPIDGRFAHASADYDYGLRAVDAGVSVLLAPGTMGTCPRNPDATPWADPSITVPDRFRKLFGRKGVPPRSTARYLRRHGGLAWPLFWLSRYLRALPSVIRPGRPDRTKVDR